MPKPSYKQKFRSEWLMDKLFKDWIVRKEDSSGESYPECKFCRCIVSNSNKYSDLKAHMATKKHIANSNMLAPSRQRTIDFPKKAVNKTKSCEAYTSLFIAEHCSVLTVDHLSLLLKKVGHDSDGIKDMHLHRTKCSHIIKNVLSPHFKDDLKEDIGQEKFSLLLDESTDISVTKYLGLVIIYYSIKAKKITTSFLKLAPLTECTADGIISALKATLNEFGLDYKNISGIGTDNASVMTGVNNGVFAKLKADIPGLVLVRCVCHSIQLAVSHASEGTIPRNLEFLISETYNWFSQSSTRQAEYKELYKTINEGHDPLKIVRACQTRWLSIHSAVERILKQWCELKTHFEISNRNYTAEMLYRMYRDDMNLAFTSFLCPILEELQRVNKAFQAKNADPCKLFKDLSTLLGFLVAKIIIPRPQVDPLTINVENYLDPKPYLGYGFETKIGEMREKRLIDEQTEREQRQRCINFIIKLIQQLRCRLPDNIDILQKVELLSCKNVLKVHKESISSLLAHFHYSSNTITLIESQWSAINFTKWNKVDNTIEFWSEVKEYKDASNTNPFKELSDFAFHILTLPYSNAEVERVFSVMNNVKTKLRNRMKTDMVNAILNIRAGLKRNEKTCYTYELPDKVLNQIGTTQSYSQPSTSTAPEIIETPNSDDDLDNIELDSF